MVIFWRIMEFLFFEASKEFDKCRDKMNGAKARCLRLEFTEGKGIKKNKNNKTGIKASEDH